jgi:glycosyltransferase involved in cell wall biosynthesis
MFHRILNRLTEWTDNKILMLQQMEKILYIITFASDTLNYRVNKIFQNSTFFDNIIIVSSSKIIGPNQISVSSYKNPLRFIKRIIPTKLYEWINNSVYFPSSKILLIRHILKVLSPIIGSKIAINKVFVLTIVPPHDLALVGYRLKSQYPEIVWLNDWQDLWTNDEYYFHQLPKLFQKKLLKLEKQMFDLCDLNITSNKKAYDVLVNKYLVDSHRIISIPHPFDKDDIKQGISLHKSKSTYNTLKIGFLGYINKPPKVPGIKILESIDLAIKYLLGSGINLEFHLYGDDQPATAEIIKNLENPSIYLHPRTSHEESLLNLSENDFLLIVLSKTSDNTKIIMHEKLPHYLMLQMPIIAMVPEDSFVAEVIRETNCGFVIADENNWASILIASISNFDFSTFEQSINQAEINTYSKENILALWELVVRKFQ